MKHRLLRVRLICLFEVVGPCVCLWIGWGKPMGRKRCGLRKPWQVGVLVSQGELVGAAWSRHRSL